GFYLCSGGDDRRPCKLERHSAATPAARSIVVGDSSAHPNRCRSLEWMASPLAAMGAAPITGSGLAVRRSGSRIGFRLDPTCTYVSAYRIRRVGLSCTARRLSLARWESHGLPRSDPACHDVDKSRHYAAVVRTII